MNKIVAVVALSLSVLPGLVFAGDYYRPVAPAPGFRIGNGRPPAPYYGGGYRHDGDGAYRHGYGGGRYYGNGGYGPYYGGYAPYYYGSSHHNDDALWAIGGLVVGAIVASAIHQSAAQQPAAVPAAPPAPPRHVQTCYDDIVYDAAGNPQIQRRCYQSVMP